MQPRGNGYATVRGQLTATFRPVSLRTRPTPDLGARPKAEGSNSLPLQEERTTMPTKTEGNRSDAGNRAERRSGGGGGGGGGLQRITVNLTPRSAAALELASQLTGDTKTDTVNRAIQIYAYLEQIISQGGAVHVQETADADLQLLKIFG